MQMQHVHAISIGVLLVQRQELEDIVIGALDGAVHVVAGHKRRANALFD
jgi:hypothetical protein